MVSEAPSSPDPGSGERLDADGESGRSTAGREGQGTQPPLAQRDGSHYLFSGIGVRSPVEELERVYEQKLRGLRSREDEALAEKLARAYELVRRKLVTMLESGGGRAPTTEVE